MRTPEQTNRERAERVRRYWRRPELRDVAVARLASFPDTEPTVATWRAILRGEHPLVQWLEGVAPPSALPDVYEGGVSPRMIFASHPFPPVAEWSILPTSR